MAEAILIVDDEEIIRESLSFILQKEGYLVREAARLVGGSGGGKPDLAQAGGPEPAGLDKALAKVRELVASATA